MIEKFISIENIGKFRDCQAAGDVELRRHSLVYAENGRGKTTICDVLRSLRTGDGAFVRGRETLGSEATPTIKLRLENSIATFDGTAWSETLPELRIYDSLFVSQNVYSGELVEHEQKRNLYRVIVGEKGVQLATKVDQLDADVKTADSDIRVAKAAVSSLAPPALSPDEYVAIAEDSDIDKRIAEKESELTALRRAEEIASRPLLPNINVPALPATLPTVLAKRLEDVSAATEKLVRNHLKDHTADGTEPWLAKGVGFETGGECPFCQQPIDENDLVAAYRVYFGATYKALRAEVSTLRDVVTAFGSDSQKLTIRQTAQSNVGLIEFWRQFVPLGELHLEVDDLLSRMEGLRAIAIGAVDAKAADLLEAATLGGGFEAASVSYEEARTAADLYNAAATDANTLISAKKGQTGAGNLERAEAELLLLRATKQRHEPDPSAACQAYIDACSTKRTLEAEKAEAKEELDKHSGDLLGTFQKRINQLLEMVTAGFRLTKIAREYKGRSPRSTFQVLINDVAVELGDDKTPNSRPSFRNTLSAGDRSTLALAFFLAQLELDPEISKKVVVFDDPFTSQDFSRRTWTQQRICRIAAKAKQVIVLSHEPSFLRLIYDAVPSAEVRTLQFCRIGQESTTITPWDIFDATRGDYFKNHGLLTAFANDGEGDPRDVAKTIRLVLEAYFRFKFPGEFEEKEWLGDFIGKIRDAKPGDALRAPQRLLEDLEDINDYAKKYHHDKNAGAESEPVNDGELRGFVRRTLELVGGF